MSKTNIEWSQHVWNPIAGCSIVSPGCTNCYAMKMAHRIEMANAEAAAKYQPERSPQYNGTTKRVNGQAVWTGHVAFSEKALMNPLDRKVPTTWFVNSMSDLFHESVPNEWIDKVFAVMALTPQHTYQILTKRSARMREYLTTPHAPGKFITIDDDGTRSDTPSAHVRAHSAMCDLMPKASARALNDVCAWQEEHYAGGDGFMRRWPLPNVWLGVSTERQKEADERIPDLLATPAAVRFISAEPLLGPIVLDDVCDGHKFMDFLRGNWWHDCDPPHIERGHPKLDWVIVGGENGDRPMHPDHARSLRDQCAAAGVPFFFKQWGTNIPDEERDGRYRRVPKSVAGRLLDGREHNGMPETAG